MHTLADQLDIFGTPAAEPLTRANAAAEPGSAEKPNRCPRCALEQENQRFYGPCGSCRAELRTGATIDRPRPAPANVAADPGPPPRAGGLTTRQRAAIVPRVCAFVALDARRPHIGPAEGVGVTEDGRRWTVPAGGAGALLDSLPGDVGQIYICGARPGGGDAHTFRAWVDATGGRWHEPAERGHWLHRLMFPVLRYADDTGRRVELARAASWYDDTAGPDACAAAHRHLRRIIADRFDGAPVLATAATTGRRLWLAGVPDHGWPRVTDEIAELIRATAGQHRYEAIDHGADRAPTPLVEVDGRMMYAALCAALPAGVPVRGAGEPDHLALGYGPAGAEHVRGRFRCSWIVPAGWEHVGLLPEPDTGGGGWHYPRRPGQRATGWLDGAELQLARRWRWPVTVHEHIAWPKARVGPLDAWARRLVHARDDAGELDASEDVRELVRAGVRAILLHGLGAMHGRPQLVTRTAELHDTAAIPAGAIGLRSLDGRWTWAEPDPRGRWGEADHPEWTAAVWARERVRVLDGPGAGGTRTGALHLPFPSIIGFVGDAIYLTTEPGWADDGRVGRLRHKRTYPGSWPAPATFADLQQTISAARGAGQ